MDAFFLPLVAAALAEWGDKTQIVAMLLAMRFAKPIPILIAIAAAAAINMSIAAFGGSLLTQMIAPDAALLFLALGFLFAAVGAFIPFRDPDAGEGWKIGAFATSFAAFLAVEFGDKTQFITAGFGAISPHWPFAAAGATLGVLLGCAPAVMLGSALRETLPLPTIRKGIGALFLLISSIIAINAFSLI
ncbi:TMEM165/GDT1 family protein [Parasphingopyxis algicola]|uniref:TMEM165/GDT1 family protein n=1 Tax=Parasphingopyxis algicola TaxID=2026624 RepID=UPI0015A43FB3|nr:TMEM165/GDT1 family protein [Parasphingopyxis algicola]QLC25302.1 TMEM165/GDT1 family protein [Parasphingopyxis algicola]